MEKQLKDLERLMHLYSPAQVAVWLGLSDPRPIHQWIMRGTIPRTRLAKIEQLLKKKGSDHARVIRRSNGKKEKTV